MEPSNTSVKFFARGGEGINILYADPMLYDEATEIHEDPAKTIDIKAKVSSWSPDGMLLALADPAQGIVVVELGESAEAGEQANQYHVISGSSKLVISLTWSPHGSTLVSYFPYVKTTPEPNVQIWRRSTKDGCESGGGTGEWLAAASFTHPKLERDKMVLQWTSEETFCAHLCPDGTVKIHDGADLAGAPYLELSFEHPAETFEFAPLSRVRAPLKARLAVFVPDVRDDMQRVIAPGEVTIWEILSTDAGGLQYQPQKRGSAVPISSGQNAELKWNSTGSALLAHCTTEVDETGKSYYGGAVLTLISSDGQYTKELTEEADPGSSPAGMSVQAVDWSPTRDEFILIQGFQPAQVMLWSWDEKAQKATLVKILVEKAHRNTIRFNSFGSLVCLAGFGNLAGDIDFFGRCDDEKCDYVKVSSCTANCTVSSEWAPDGRHLLTAVVAPRMRVDNGVGVWKALTGTKVTEKTFEELFEAQWRPEPPQSIRFLDVSPEEVESANKACVESSQGDKKKSAYRPPKARVSEGNANSVSAMMRGEAAVPFADDRRGRRPWQQRRDNEDVANSPSMAPSEPPTGAPPLQKSPRQSASPESKREERNQERNHGERSPPRSAPPTAPPSSPPPRAAEAASPGPKEASEGKAGRTPPSQRPPPPPAPPPPGPVPQAPWAQERGLVPDRPPLAAPDAAPVMPPKAPPSEAPRAPPPKGRAYPAGPPPSQPPQQQQATPAAPPPTQPAPRNRQQPQQQQQQQREAANQGYPEGVLAAPPTRSAPPAHAPSAQQQQAQAQMHQAAEAVAALGFAQQQQRQPQPGLSAFGLFGDSREQQLHALRQQQAQLAHATSEFPGRGHGMDPASADSAVIAAYSHAAAQQAAAAQQMELATRTARYMQMQQAQQQGHAADLMRQQQQRAAAQQASQLQAAAHAAQQQQEHSYDSMRAKIAAAQAAQAATAERAAQQQSRGDEKRACPGTGWQYIDPKGTVQGPFTLLEMQLWNSMGYFRVDLPMRCDTADPFVEFNKLFPPPSVPFESYPRRVNGANHGAHHGR